MQKYLCDQKVNKYMLQLLYSKVATKKKQLLLGLTSLLAFFTNLTKICIWNLFSS